MSNIPYNYYKYLDDVTKMRQRGAISSGEQINSPSSAGSRGLAKLTQFTNNPNQLMKGNLTESATREYQNLPKDKKLDFDIWLEPNEGLIFKVQYNRLGNWEYRIKNFE